MSPPSPSPTQEPLTQETSTQKPKVPSGFIDLHNAQNKLNVQQNIIGVCLDFLPATKSGGKDYTMKFRLHDPSWNGRGGMAFRFFHKIEGKLPLIEHQGDVIILRNVKTTSWNGSCGGLSNAATEWIVLPFSAMQGTLDDIKPTVMRSSHGSSMSLPSVAELRYAKYISEQEDPSQWPGIANTAHILTNNQVQRPGDHVSPRKQKFSEVQAIELPSKGSSIYVELLGEVRKVFSTDMRTELAITDYTSHPLLYNYRHGGDEDGRDGDQFNYIKDDLKLWPGPWGTRTMTVTLWDAHHQFAISNVKEGSFVYLRNVKIKLDKSGLKLEGSCNGDGYDEHKVNVELRKGRDANGDELLKNLLRRKREYEAEAAAGNIHFVRDAQSNKRKLDPGKQHQQEEDIKSKKTRTRERKKKNRKSKAENEQEVRKPISNQEMSPHTLNLNIRCSNHAVPDKTIADILDPIILQRKTPKGNSFSVPFQNCKYKSKVRVVDFFPDNVEDFAVPLKDSEYDVLSDHGSGPESEVDLSQGCADGVKWVWRFFLLVEDAQPPKGNDKVGVQMQLLVAGTDGEFLLNQEAFDMRDEKNKVMLARTKEKLFHLWGDLQEWKEERQTSNTLTRTSQARPFECLIKEYGALVPSYLRTSREQDAEYERIFRMFGVNIG